MATYNNTFGFPFTPSGGLTTADLAPIRELLRLGYSARDWYPDSFPFATGADLKAGETVVTSLDPLIVVAVETDSNHKSATVLLRNGQTVEKSKVRLDKHRFDFDGKGWLIRYGGKRRKSRSKRKSKR
jgi:hypothetical protein